MGYVRTKKDEQREKRKRKNQSDDKCAFKKVKKDSVLSERHQLVRVQEIQARASSSALAVDNVDWGGDTSPNLDVPFSTLATSSATVADIIPVTDGTSIEDGGT